LCLSNQDLKLLQAQLAHPVQQPGIIIKANLIGRSNLNNLEVSRRQDFIDDCPPFVDVQISAGPCVPAHMQHQKRAIDLGIDPSLNVRLILSSFEKLGL
jgi:hypothetical protein